MIRVLKKVIPLMTLVILGCGNDDHSVTSANSPMTDDQLEKILLQRFDGDRTGVCVAAAYLEAESVARAIVCADPAEHRLDFDSVSLEIGSVTKTMTAAIVASLIKDGQLQINDPLSKYLPANINVPTFQGEPVLIKHLLTHTSGLPRESVNLDPFNPYSLITDETLINELNSTVLNFAPGSKWEYSNFGYMVLGYVIASVTGSDLETLMQQRLFTPLGMHSFINQVPESVTQAIGYKASNRQPATSMDFLSPNMAGIGGVRATLNDMILYSQAQLGYGDPDTVDVLKLTQQQIDIGPNYPADAELTAMAWGISPIEQGYVLYHGGDTLGFSSLVVIDPEHKRALVMLEDTRLETGRYEVAAHILDPTIPLPPPRLEAIPDLSLLQALQGNYLIDGIVVAVSYSGTTLTGTFPDGTSLEFGYDSRGDFYPIMDEFALLIPFVNQTGQQTFIWIDAENQLVAEPVN